MQKLFWGLTALAVAAAGGMFWLKWQGPTSPFNFATAAIRCCRPAPDGYQGPGGGSRRPDNPAVPDNGEDDLTNFQKPAEPVEIAQIELPAAPPDLAAAIDFTPVPVVPAITIREPLEVAQPVAVAEGGGTERTILPAGWHETPPEVPALLPQAPRFLPFFDGADQPPPKMDRPIDDGDDDPVSIWWSFFHWWSGHPADAMPDEVDPSDCREDRHYHDQYPECPYLGPTSHPKPYTEPRKKAPALKESDQAMYRQHLRKLRRLGEDGLLFPEVDTMEFRSSDLGPFDHWPNPA